MTHSTWESFVRCYPPGSVRWKILKFVAARGSVPCTSMDAIATAGVRARDRTRALGFVAACVRWGYLCRDGTGIVAAHLIPPRTVGEIVYRAFQNAVSSHRVGEIVARRNRETPFPSPTKTMRRRRPPPVTKEIS